jgi:hypothetical protein
MEVRPYVRSAVVLLLAGFAVGEQPAVLSVDCVFNVGTQRQGMLSCE